MKRPVRVLVLSVIALLYGADLLGDKTQAAGWQTVILPAGQLASAVILFYTYLKTNKNHIINLSWLFLALGCFSWMAGEIVFNLNVFGVAGPWSADAALWLNTTANLFFVAAVGMFVFMQTKRWNGARLVLDAVMLTVALVLTIWILLMRRDINAVGILTVNGIASAIRIVANLLVAMGMTIWLLSVKSGRVPAFIKVLTFGLLLFVASSLAYYYILYYGSVVTMSMMMYPFNASVILIGCGALMERLTKKDKQISTLNMYGEGNRAAKHAKELGLLLVPVLAMAVGGFIVSELLHYLAVLAIYKILSSYFEVSAKKDKLLQEQKRLNYELEAIVAQRTQRLRDMNVDLRSKNQQLGYLSTRDTLTSLYNRRYLLNWLEDQIAHAEPGRSVTLMYMDLDRFKLINDTYGHDMGDQVLLETAKRLSNIQCGQQTILARMGGDEFVLACAGAGSSRTASETAASIIAQCSQDINIGEYVFKPAMCIGISIWPYDAADMGALLKNADIALYNAKGRGINRYASFSLMMQRDTQWRNKVEILLRQATVSEEFTLHYQPQFSLPNNALVGAEALLRWNSAVLGSVPPSDFIPVAEETGHINEIGMWVLREAAAQAARWNTRFGNGLIVGVNISPKQLNNAALANELKQLAARDDFNPAWLDIEITENVALEGEYRLSQIFNLFKSTGMSVSIDDFGTGYSSIMSLKHFPFDRLKIAKPLVDSVTMGTRNEQIVRSIILLAKSIGMQTIAEGVETQAQYNKLMELGCGQIQGYLLGRPVPAAEFEALYLNGAQAELNALSR